jgi:1-acyl-sn-glycerol-3-phosphate acyltransferase
MRSRFYAIISIPLFAILYCYTALGVFIALILGWLNLKGAVRFLFQLWAKSVFLIIGKKLSVHGKENIFNGRRYILVANHSSLFDIVAIMSFYPEVSWFGHERLLKVPFFGKLLGIIGYVPFREPTVKNTKEMLEQLLTISKTQSVAIFPEGTRTLNGNINDFYKGFIHLFRTTDIEILPVTMNGFYKLKPKNRSSINFDSRLDVIIHGAISREKLIGKSDNEIITTVKDVIESAYYK